MSLLNNQYFNSKLKDKAYLIEFYYNYSLQHSFSFCLPAQNEQITSPQKIYETKTFDGSVIDDYGNDVEQINLSGSTYNSDIRLIYSGLGVEREVTGEEEIFKLRDLLRTYGKNDKLINKHVYLYDLSSPKFKTWEVFPKDLKIERSKDNPFSYNYNISFLGNEDNRSNSRYKRLNWLESLVENFNKFKDKANSYADLLKVGMVYFEDALDIITTFADLIDQTEGIIKNYVDVVNGYLGASAKVINETVGLGDYALKSPLRIYSMGISVFNSTKQLLEACNNLKNWCRNIGSSFEKSADIIEKQYNASESEVIDEWNRLTNQMCMDAEYLHTLSIMSTTNTGFVCVPGGESDDTIKVTYGFKERILKDSDTWDGLAYEVYGDATLGILLAAYNGTINENSNSEIVAGKKIFIPILEESKSTSNNEVYNEPGYVDNYGKDISIVSEDYQSQNGDIAVTSGTNTLTQALMSRLYTSINDRIRNNVYGIRSTVGLSLAIANNYLASSIMQTILADPRVQDVQNLKWNGKGTELHIEFSYTDINGQNQNYGG